MNPILPITANIKANNSLNCILKLPNINMPIINPNLALSVTPTTSGETNLLLVMVCKIKPLIESPIAVNIMVIVLGNLEAPIKNHIALSKLISPLMVTLETPTIKETNDNPMNKIIKIHLRFNKIHPLLTYLL